MFYIWNELNVLGYRIIIFCKIKFNSKKRKVFKSYGVEEIYYVREGKWSKIKSRVLGRKRSKRNLVGIKGFWVINKI